MAPTRLTAGHPTMNPYVGTILTDRVTLDPTVLTTNFMVLDRTAIAAANPSFMQTESRVRPHRPLCSVRCRSALHDGRKTIEDSPTSVPQKKEFTPDNTYSRVGVIFKVSGTEVVKSERARFIAAVALEDDELETTEKDIVGYYEVASSP